MNSKDLMYKLEKVERSINIYFKSTEQLLREININIPLEQLVTIVTPKKDDSHLYLGYLLDEKLLEDFNKELGNIIEIDTNLYYYVLECHGNYNWQNKNYES